MNTARVPSAPLAFYSDAPRLPAATAPPASAARRARKPFTRRRGDRSQLVRRSFQAAFLLLNLWIGARFYLCVRYYEPAAQTLRSPGPPGVEGWLPIAGLMNLKYLALTGTCRPSTRPGCSCCVAFLLDLVRCCRKAFCSWLCPVGTISEWLWQGGREMFGRNVRRAALARHPAARPQVPAARLLRLRRRPMPAERSRVPREPVRRGRRREDAGLLPAHGHDRRRS